jgi:multiple sugar transport system permease protein
MTSSAPSQSDQAGSIAPDGRSRNPDRLIAILFVLPALVLVAGLMYYPMLRAVVESMFKTDFLNPTPQFIGLENYRDMVRDRGFWQVIGNSLIWTIGVVLLQNAIGMAVAVLLNQNLPLRGLTRTLVLLPWILPGIVAAILWRFMYDPQLGLVNSILISLGVIEESVAWLAEPSTAMFAVIIAAVWKGYPFSTIIYLAALQTMDEEQLEAAEMDGANAWQRFRGVMLPAMSHIIYLNLLLTTIFTFNYFDMIWVTTKGGPLNRTHIFPTTIFQIGFGEFRFGVAAAYGVVAVLMLAGLAILYLRELNPRGER